MPCNELQSATTQPSPDRIEPRVPPAVSALQEYGSGPSRGVTPMTPMSCLLMSALLPGRPPSTFPVRSMHEGLRLSPPFQQVILRSWLQLRRAWLWHQQHCSVLSMRAVIHTFNAPSRTLKVTLLICLQLWQMATFCQHPKIEAGSRHLKLSAYAPAHSHS